MSDAPRSPVRRLADRLRRTSKRTRAAILSFVLPGLGQAYVDRIGRAVIWLLGIVALNVALRDQVRGVGTALLALTLNLASAIDAAIVAPGRSDTPVERR